MAQYIVVKNGEYISNQSAIGYHYVFTNKRNEAYVFEEFEYEDARFIAEAWGMWLKELI